MTSNGRLTFFLGVNTGYVSDGQPDHRYLKFYGDRSSPELHCAIVGNVVVPGGFASNAMTPTISDRGIWARVAEEIRDKGSLPGIQLATAWEGYVGPRSFRANNGSEVITNARNTVSLMTARDITHILDAFDEGASLAISHGFGHVQVHAAHGYLLNLLVDPRIYPDAHRVHDRLSQFAKQLRKKNIESSIRISLNSGNAELDGLKHVDFQNLIAALPFDFIDVSSGFYNVNKQLIYPSRPDTLEARRRETIALAVSHPRTSFILSGRAMSIPSTDLPRNVHLGLCRDLIANPHFLEEPGRGCRNRGKCHYYSRGEDSISCPRWSIHAANDIEVSKH